jgi:D-alanine-D-alanine ligase
VSLQSAKNIADAIDRGKYAPVPIGIDRTGRWHLYAQAAAFLVNSDDPKRIALAPGGVECSPEAALAGLDVVFPALHGPFGEDGTVQGLLKFAGLPFVGSGVAGSAIGMDKDISKRLLREAGLPVCKSLTLLAGDRLPTFAEAAAALGRQMFVKPANMGSSVGVSKIHDEVGYEKSIAAAFDYDNKVLLEEAIQGRELECAVLEIDGGSGLSEILAAPPGEVIPGSEFYSYDAKYIDENGARLSVPAKLEKDKAAELCALAIKAFKTLCASGLARVDFFLDDSGRLYINEINTMPGFTRISMYPKLWEAAGLSYSALIDRLIKSALHHTKRETRLYFHLRKT